MAQAGAVPVVVHNVTNAGAIAEGRVGAAKGARSYVWVCVGHGLGAGIVIDGQLFSGTKGFSGEIGHCPGVDDGQLCSCGLRGCLETLASGKAIERIASEAARGCEPTQLSAHSAPFDTAVVLDAARAGDAVAQRILCEVGQHLGVGLSKVEVVASTLGDRAGLMGSVIAAMDQAVRSYRIVATAERLG
jgi:N-acetylglucosamine repressor